MIAKVIYFDEGSATDFLHIIDGGKVDQKAEKITEVTTELAAKAAASLAAKFKWLPFLGANVDMETNVGANRSGNTIINKAITNTILTDYIDLVQAQTEGREVIKTFKNYKLKPYPESFAYYKMMTPYLIMAEGNFEAEGMAFNVSRMDEALESGRGYYELIAEGSTEKIILRFNIQAFRNNYGIADLVKMRLTYHAIEVGVFPEDKLSMKEEFSNSSVTLTGADILNDEEGVTEESAYLKVYDVILAGVEV